eukprot:m.193558 g.193558  ORF g.193558 m.193558 type:complete len:336 (-) comp18636_c0_seq9:924-1931(-)
MHSRGITMSGVCKCQSTLSRVTLCALRSVLTRPMPVGDTLFRSGPVWCRFRRAATDLQQSLFEEHSLFRSSSDTSDTASSSDCTLLEGCGGLLDTSTDMCVPRGTTPDQPDTPSSMLIASMGAWTDNMDLLDDAPEDAEWEDLVDGPDHHLPNQEQENTHFDTRTVPVAGRSGPSDTEGAEPSQNSHARAMDFFTSVVERHGRHGNGAESVVPGSDMRSSSAGDGDYDNILNFFDVIGDAREPRPPRRDTPTSLLESSHPRACGDGGMGVDVAAVTRYIGNAKHILRNYLVHEQTHVQQRMESAMSLLDGSPYCETPCTQCGQAVSTYTFPVPSH